ncbi:Replicative DNA helicase [Georgfuchsia toluolica]|uniref:Replicative DNA helicase n=1 Tax=Georgfuchsia toluolica TaxID=424218 RepID=A0A916J2B4_9PROT|nr:replicative DNA helicase [Georgfuchsia toluolica]CAG4882687.1 Replicative DNA helicase [Georgfuchsia toluolica]
MSQVRAFNNNQQADPQIAALRLPPHSIEAEQSLIGGLLLDNTAWDRIGDVVSDADFYRDDHRRIFIHIRKLVEAGRPADVVTVYESIEKSNEVDQTGGLAYLGEIANNTPSAANIRRYAEIVRERAVLRKLVTVGDEIAASALNPAGREAKQLLDIAEQKVFEIAEAGSRNMAGFVSIQPLLGEAVDRMQQLYDRDDPSEITGTPTGFTDLDRMTSGLQPGDMVVIAGRPSMGKTAFALNIAEHVGVDLGLPVAIFSLEMSGPQLAMRFLSSVASIDQSKMRSAKQLTDNDWDKMTVALGRLHDAPIHIDETGAINATDLRARARRLHRQCGKLGLIVIDYLQLMSSTRSGENRATEISEVSRSIKSLAKELQVPILALSQLSRKVEERNDKRPLMSDLRESGAIEQDADIIMMMYRDEYYNENPQNKGLAEVIIGKHRNGPTGKVTLTFIGEYAKFVNSAAPGHY